MVSNIFIHSIDINMTTGTFILQTIVEGRIKRKCEEEREINNKHKYHKVQDGYQEGSTVSPQ